MSNIFQLNTIDEVITTIEEEVEWFFGDWPEGEGIGTSDVGNCYRAVIDKLCSDSRGEAVTDAEQTLIMNGIHNTMSEVLERNRLTN